MTRTSSRCASGVLLAASLAGACASEGESRDGFAAPACQSCTIHTDTLLVATVDSGRHVPSELSSIVAWGENYVIASADRSHLLFIDASTGKLVSVAGKPGRGPGELNSVGRLTSIGRDYLLVSQDGGDDLLFDRDMAYIATLPKNVRCGYPVGAKHMLCFKRAPLSGERVFSLFEVPSLKSTSIGPFVDSSTGARSAACLFCDAAVIMSTSAVEGDSARVTLASTTHRILQSWRLDGAALSRLVYSLPASIRDDSLRSPRPEAYPIRTRNYGGWKDEHGRIWIVISARANTQSSATVAKGSRPVSGDLQSLTSGRTSIVAVYGAGGQLLAQLEFAHTIVMPISVGRIVTRNYSPTGFMEYRILSLSITED